MGGRRQNFDQQNQLIQQRFDSLTNYRRQLIESGTQELKGLGSDDPSPFSGEVQSMSGQRQELLDMASNINSRRGESTGSQVSRSQLKTQLMLQALETQDPLNNNPAMFYNPVTGTRETLGSSKGPGFGGSLRDFENQVRQTITDQIRLQTEPFMQEFDKDRMQLIDKMSRATDPTQRSQLEQQLQQLEGDRVQTFGGVLEDLTGQQFDFLDLEGSDRASFESFTGQSLDQFLARTEQEVVDIFGEEQAAVELERRNTLTRQYNFNKQLGRQQQQSTDFSNKQTQIANQNRQEQAQQIRKEASQQKAEFNRQRNAKPSSGLSLFFQERPL